MRGERQRHPANGVDRLGIRIDPEDLVTFAQEEHEVASGAAPRVEDAHAGSNPGPQQLIEEVDIDVAELFLEARHHADDAMHRRAAWQPVCSPSIIVYGTPRDADRVAAPGKASEIDGALGPRRRLEDRVDTGRWSLEAIAGDVPNERKDVIDGAHGPRNALHLRRDVEAQIREGLGARTTVEGVPDGDGRHCFRRRDREIDGRPWAVVPLH